jgi:hypothetical protein
MASSLFGRRQPRLTQKRHQAVMFPFVPPSRTRGIFARYRRGIAVVASLSVRRAGRQEILRHFDRERASDGVAAS